MIFSDFEKNSFLDNSSFNNKNDILLDLKKNIKNYSLKMNN